VLLSVIRSHVLIGGFRSHGFIHSHVVVTNATVADATEIGHCRGDSGDGDLTLLELSV
jgi:hypothetical protein